MRQHRGTLRQAHYCFLVSLLLSIPGSLAQSPHTASAQSAQEHARRGLALAQAHNWPLAEQELQAAVAASPATALYRAQLASVLGLDGKWRESLKSFKRAVELEPANLNFRRETAAVQWQLGMYEDAEKNLDYVLQAQPADAGASVLLGLVRESQGQYREAGQLLDAQYDRVISQPDWTVALFEASLKNGDKEDAFRIIQVLEGRASDSSWTSAIARCSDIAARNGDAEEAQTLFALLPRASPLRQALGLQLANAFYQGGNVLLARQMLEEFQAQGQPNADVQNLLGKCLEAQHQWDSAVEAYRRSIALEPHRIEHFEDLVTLDLQLGRMEEAGQAADRAVAAFPSDAKAWVLKGDVELRMSAYMKAMDSYAHASKLNPSSADVLLDIASLHFVAGETGQAVAQYKAGMARFPKDPRFYISCAEVLLAEPDPSTTQPYAKSLLEKAIALDPESAEAHYQLGQLALQEQRWKEAEAEFLLSARYAPGRSKTHFALSQLYRRTGQNEEAEQQFKVYQSLKSQESGVAVVGSPAGKP